MKLVQVTPIISVKTLGKLSYFTSLDVELGDIVEISINKRKLLALVVEISDVNDAKLEIRNNDFSLRKIEKIAIKNAISRELINIFVNTASFVGLNLATFLEIYLPKTFLDKQQLNVKVYKDDFKLNILELNRKESIGHVKQLIREKFARDESVLIIAPTIISIEKLYEEISDGVEDRVTKYHSELTEKQKEKVFDKILSKKSICIISSPSIIGLYAHNIQNIIIHQEESKYYEHTISHANSRDAFLYLGEELGFEVSLSAYTPSIDTYTLALEKDKLRAIPNQNYFKNKINIFKMNDKDKRPFSIYLSFELKLLMDQYLLENKHIALYTQRKGMSSSSVCMDCGESVKCEVCSNDLCLFENIKTKERMYRCLTCKTKIKLDPEKEIKCTHCDSWRIATLGIGTQGLAEHIKEIYPDTNLHIIDGDHIKTKTEALKKYKAFAKEGGILIGTEMMLPLLDKIDLVGVVSLDTYFSLPDYTTDEEIMQTFSNLLFSTRESGQIVVQTRQKHPIWEFVKNNSLLKYYEYELENRKNTNLPPFTKMICFDAEENINEPAFLKNASVESYKIRGKNVTRYIYLVDKKKWATDIKLRDLVIGNLLEMNLRINTRSVLKGL